MRRIQTALIARRQSRGPHSTRSSDQAHAGIQGYVAWSKDLLDDTWKAQRRPIVIVTHPSSIGIMDFTKMHRRRWCIETLVTSHRTVEAPRRSGSRSDLHRTTDGAWQRTTIVARSWPDWGAIGARSCRDWDLLSSLNHSNQRRRRPTEIQDHDRRSIVALSWPDRAMIRAHIEAKLKSNSLRNWSRILAKWNRSHDPCKTPPQPRQLPTIFGPILSLNTHVLLPYFLTFDRFVKELSEFRGRSLVHRDPPAFRLNSEGIGAGLITNSSLISSNFPLEFRKSVRKDPSKFTPIRANWSLIIVAIGLVVRFNRLWRGNLSFY